MDKQFDNKLSYARYYLSTLGFTTKGPQLSSTAAAKLGTSVPVPSTHPGVVLDVLRL